MATKAQNQITIVDLTDAYSVMLSLDAIALNGSTTTLGSQQSVVVNVSAFRGSEQLTPSVGTPTCPANVSASVGSASNNIVPVTITFASALNAAGRVTIPVSVDNNSITINKEFSFSISFKGTNGTSVTITKTEYQQGDSNTTAPTGTWSTSVVSVAEGKYLWTKRTYSDSTVDYSVAKQGVSGNNGTSVTVTGTALAYQKSTSGTTIPSGTWSSSPVAPDASNYVWTRTTTSFSDGSTSVSYSVGGKSGTNGTNGDDGEDAIVLVIISSAGTIFKNTAIATTLTAHVYKGGAEVTGSALSALGTIKWYKDGGSTAAATGATITISAGDVTNRAIYEAKLEA